MKRSVKRQLRRERVKKCFRREEKRRLLNAIRHFFSTVRHLLNTIILLSNAIGREKQNPPKRVNDKRYGLFRNKHVSTREQPSVKEPNTKYNESNE